MKCVTVVFGQGTQLIVNGKASFHCYYIYFLFSFMEDGTPILVFGDFNIHLEKPYATDFHSLLASFDLKRLTTTSTHKSGNQLDLIYTCDCTADNILVQPL